MAVKTKKVVAKPKFKSYISDFTINFGPLSLRGKMIGVRKSNTEPKFKLVSPDGNPVEQTYIDTVTGNKFKAGECDRQFENAGEVIQMDKVTLDAIKVSDLAPNVITLTVHRTDDVKDLLYPSDNNGYLFLADDKDPKNLDRTAALIAAVNDSPDKALFGTCNFHSSEGLFRVSVWRGYLVLQKTLYPTQVNDHDSVPIVVTNDAKIIKSFMDKKVEDFDPNTYRSTSITKQVAALENPETLNDLSGLVVVPSEDDLAALFESLEDFG